MKIAVFLLALLCCCPALSQDSVKKEARWLFQSAGGFNIPDARLRTGEITDHLLRFDEYSFYFQLQASYFFSQEWGLGLTIHILEPLEGRNGRAGFMNRLTEKYGDSHTFYESPETFQNPDVSGTARVFSGLCYRKRFGSLLLIPRLQAGFTNFATPPKSVEMKRNGSNIVYDLSYGTSGKSHFTFSFAPAISAFYQLSNSIYADLSLMYSFSAVNVSFAEELTNLYTMQKELSREIIYDQDVHQFSIGLGISIGIE